MRQVYRLIAKAGGRVKEMQDSKWQKKQQRHSQFIDRKNAVSLCCGRSVRLIRPFGHFLLLLVVRQFKTYN